MNKKVLIVEDQFVEANNLQIMLERAGYKVCGIARSVPIAREMIKQEKPELVLLDIFLKGKDTGIDLAKELREENIAFIYLSANSNEEILSVAKTTEPYGFIVKPFREKDLLVTLEIAQYRHEHSRETLYRRETKLIELLEQNATPAPDQEDRLLQSAKIIQQQIPFDFLAIGFNSNALHSTQPVSFLRVGFNEYQVIGLTELATITGLSKERVRNIIAASEPGSVADFFHSDKFEYVTQAIPVTKLVRDTFQMKSLLSLPLPLKNGGSCRFCCYSRRPDTFSSEHIALLQRLQPALVKIIEQRTEDDNGATGKLRMKEIKLRANEHSITNTAGFKDIIGNSHHLLNVFDQIMQVAPFDTSVLILGETGTGKEKIADCIHNHSPRKGKPLVKVNCAALPATLIESELFGHEKGSFTGATEKRIGKFEQANGGSIFLDEIGEMPLDLQVKLLRVLQEKEIEAIGGKSTIRIDVRFIAATNRNLEKEVAGGRFRLDLYYRLNVFPIVLPALRERLEDLPALAQHFIAIFNQRSGKSITGLSEKVLRNMMAYSWPGNIRELENVIERSVLLTKGTTIEDVAILPRGKHESVTMNDKHIKTIHENEREHIIVVLKKCNGRVWGPGGAAELLNVPPSTLKSKMKKLGIPKEGPDENY